MSDAYTECLVKGKDNPMLGVGKFILIALTVLSVLGTMLGVGILLLTAIIFGAGAYIITLFTNVEYEYLYLDKEVTVDKVYNRSRRKKAATYSLDKVQVFAPIHSYHLDNYGKPTGKPVDFSIGVEEKPDRRYIMYYEGGQTILFSPSEEMVKMMKNAAPRKVFTD